MDLVVFDKHFSELPSMDWVGHPRRAHPLKTPSNTAESLREESHAGQAVEVHGEKAVDKRERSVACLDHVKGLEKNVGRGDVHSIESKGKNG